MVEVVTATPIQARKLPIMSRSNKKDCIARKRKKKLKFAQAKKIVESLKASNSLLLLRIFDSKTIRRIWEELGCSGRNRVYTPELTISLFVQQMLSKGTSCQEMVLRVNAQRKKDHLVPISTDSSSYCEARARLPLELIEILFKKSSQNTFDYDGRQGKWWDRRVFLVDGMVVSAPDTPANQEVYPQSSSQKVGLGFPQVRLLASICLKTGLAHDVQYGPILGKKTGEISLFRQMLPTFKRGDIIVGDAIFDCYRELSQLKMRGIDVVCEINGTRANPFSGKCVSVEDKVVKLSRPNFNPSRFTREEWEALPESIKVRLIRYQVNGRKDQITIVTTLMNEEKYPAVEVAKLYGFRWNCELDIRSIKSVMGMVELRCCTPAMLEREIMVYFLAYNLIRISMLDAAVVADVSPRELSFKSAMKCWQHMGSSSQETSDFAHLLWSIATCRVGNRPGRQEPRKIKRRNGKYPKMNKPRALEKLALSP
jgi:Transposase DDE domain